jgi:hypothetical protein
MPPIPPHECPLFWGVGVGSLLGRRQREGLSEALSGGVQVSQRGRERPHVREAVVGVPRHGPVDHGLEPVEAWHLGLEAVGEREGVCR